MGGVGVNKVDGDKIRVISKVYIPFNFKFSNQSRIDQVQNLHIARFLTLVSFLKAICKLINAN